MAGKFEQFKRYILFKEEFVFILSLYRFLNEKVEIKNRLYNEHIQFEINYSDFKKFLRKLEQYASMSCGVVCPSNNECDGHRTLKYLQQYEQFIIHMVYEENIFYKNILVIKEGKNTDPMLGYIFIPKDKKDLSGKTFSQRFRYLN